MKRFLMRIARLITDFWVVNADQAEPHYPDYPVSPFGPTRLISKETIHKIING